MPARILALLCVCALLPASAQSPSSPDRTPTAAVPTTAGSVDLPGSLAERITALLAASPASRAHWGISVRRFDGSVLFERDPEKLFRPASTAKLFTTAAAMTLLGPGDTTSTTLSFPAPQAGIVQGDLTLTSTDDPDLSAAALPWTRTPPPSAADASAPDPVAAVRSFVRGLQERGVQRITGKILVPVLWDPYPQGWEQEDLLWGYGAPVTSAGFHDNQLQLTVTGGSLPGEPAQASLSPAMSFYRIDSTLTTVAKAADASGVTVHHDPGDGSLRLSGSVMAKSTYRTEIAIDDPPLLIARALRDGLLAAGITVEGAADAPRSEPEDVSFLKGVHQPVDLGSPRSRSEASSAEDGTRESVVRTSSPLATDIVRTLKESQNLHAELILRRLGARYLEDSTVAGARVLHQWLLGIGVAEGDVSLFDGSGLSTKDLVTPRAETQLLFTAMQQPWFSTWKSALPVGGVDGTLQARFTEPPLRGNIYAKTGTLGETRALAGFVRCRSGQQLIVSIMVDNHLPGDSSDRSTMDSIVALLAAWN